VASLKVIHARNPSFLGTQYTKIKSARKICTRTKEVLCLLVHELSYKNNDNDIYIFV
jgi:hypothetical protein